MMFGWLVGCSVLVLLCCCVVVIVEELFDAGKESLS